MCFGWTQKMSRILLLVNATARRSTTQRHKHESHQISLCYTTLVRDSVLPPGFGEAFSRLEQPANLAADLQDITQQNYTTTQGTCKRASQSHAHEKR